MKFYIQLLKFLINKYIKRYETGKAIKIFCENMGLAYIKFAQILSTQNYGNIFTENDRIILSSICDSINPVPFEEIKKEIEKEYSSKLEDIFEFIDESPVGSASISQVHRAMLKSGEEVAIKVKRKDITESLEKDIECIRKLMHRYGKFIKFGNYSGGDKALNLYLKWILQETDFNNEMKNIKKYTSFAGNVNGKVYGNKDIKIPKLYEELCTENIIVMEYIPYKTINKLELNDKNKEKIRIALNSYISLSLYAMFNNLQIIFHGDPHGGNIYIDNDGNIGFLDMGLLFELDEEDSKLTKDFFFAAYTRNYEKMYELVVSYGNMDKYKKVDLKNDVYEYCANIAEKPVTSYFIDMMNICLKYEICPPNFLFCMAKAFMCLDGINNFSKNEIPGSDLLKQQVMKYFIKDSINSCINLFTENIDFLLGAIDGVCKQVSRVENIFSNINNIACNSKLILDLLSNNKYA